MNRRDFLKHSVVGVAGLAAGSAATRAAESSLAKCPVVVFSKIYQELRLDFAAAARITRAAKLDGVDCPVRDGGEIEPAQVAVKLPEYDRILRDHGLSLQLLTSGITQASTSHARSVLRTARDLGVRYYRLGFYGRDAKLTKDQQVEQVRAKLRDLALLNREVGICGLFQNHTGSFGANLEDLVAVVRELPPEQIGVAFDIGHAIIAHGSDWRAYFDALRSHLRVVYIKDVNASGKWVPFGEGLIRDSGYLRLLKNLEYQAPISLHVEFDWNKGGAQKNQSALEQALAQSTAVLRQWIQEA